MRKPVARAFATGARLVGLGRLPLRAALGALVQDLLPRAAGSWLLTAEALLLKLPVPLYVISIGPILLRRWLSPSWRRGVWRAMVVSGCWHGVAAGARWWRV